MLVGLIVAVDDAAMLFSDFCQRDYCTALHRWAVPLGNSLQFRAQFMPYYKSHAQPGHRTRLDTGALNSL